MESNIIRAIINLVHNPIVLVDDFSKSSNRVNIVGESLEEYVKNLFANTVSESDAGKRDDEFKKYFSYEGTQNNPPDLTLFGGDAIEVKKIQSKYAGIALNSSFPKAKLYSDDKMLASSCFERENWTEKDVLYVIGVVNRKVLKSLCMIYGMDYAANADVYENIKNAIKDGVLNIPDINFTDTNELGRVNLIDPLEITFLRIRGMWQIENPLKVFADVYQTDDSKDFNMMALINFDKYFSFKESDLNELEKLEKEDNLLSIKDVKIKNPDNPEQLRDAKLITFSI